MPLPTLPESKRFSEPEFEPYFKAIGQVAVAWNALHEDLAQLFCKVMGGSFLAEDLWLTIWHSILYDRPKRAMLRGVIEARKEKLPQQVDAILWIIKKADKLENSRNDAVHTPLHFTGFLSLPVMPDRLSRNPRSVRPSENEDLLSELHWTFEYTLTLRDFTRALDAAWARGQPSPDKPSLPTRKAKNKSPRKQRKVQKR